MKAEERHKLKSNQLADYAELIGDWGKRHAKLLLAILGVILLAVGGVWFWNWRNEVKKDNARTELAKVQKKASEATSDSMLCLALASQLGVEIVGWLPVQHFSGSGRRSPRRVHTPCIGHVQFLRDGGHRNAGCGEDADPGPTSRRRRSLWARPRLSGQR